MYRELAIQRYAVQWIANNLLRACIINDLTETRNASAGRKKTATSSLYYYKNSIQNASTNRRHNNEKSISGELNKKRIHSICVCASTCFDLVLDSLRTQQHCFIFLSLWTISVGSVLKFGFIMEDSEGQQVVGLIPWKSIGIVLLAEEKNAKKIILTKKKNKRSCK